MIEPKKNLSDDRLVNSTLLLLLGLLVLQIAVLASVPPVSRDALIHHLALPKLYLQHGGMYEMPDLVFSYYPMNLDLLYMGALYLGSDILPKYIHMLFGFATVLLIFAYLRSRLSLFHALFGSVFFLSIPVVLKLSITAYVDLGVTFFSTASLIALLYWCENKFNKKYLIVAAICCGLSMGTKYNGLISLFLLTLFIPILYNRNTRSPRPAAAVLFSLSFIFIAVLVASPWFIRNIAWTGNPVYPLFDSFFNSASANNASPLAGAGISSVFATRHLFYQESIWQILLLPVRIFFEGVDNNPQFFDGRLNPFLLLLPGAALFNNANSYTGIKKEKAAFAAFAVLFFLFAVHTSVLRIRYLAPMIPPLVILSMCGINNIEFFLRKHFNRTNHSAAVRTVLILLVLLPNALYLVQQVQLVKPYHYLSGTIPRNDYLKQFRPEYQLIEYANRTLPESSNILCIFLGWRGYYLDHRHQFDHHSSPDWLISWFNEEAITALEIAQRLNSSQITHLLIRKSLFSQWLGGKDSNKQQVWKELRAKYLTYLSSHDDYILFEIAI